MSRVIVRNILVGHGNLYTTAENNIDAELPAFTAPTRDANGAITGAGSDANDDFQADPNWDSVGATQEGVEIGYDPDYGEVEVDQMKDAAKMFNTGVTVTMTTNLAEATLENLVLAWGAGDSALTPGDDVDTFTIGVPGTDPVERSAAVVGNAPTGGEYEADGVTPRPGADAQRVYRARRIVSVEGSTHALRTSEATVFPVTFRMLPYRGADGTANVGSEYGEIIDRIIS